MSHSVTLALEHVDKAFVRPESGVREVVLRNFNLRVAPGELVAVIGPSGSGKSTLLNLIAGLTLPDAGTVVLQRADGLRPRLSAVFQQPRLLDWLDVETNVQFAADAAGISHAPVAQALANVGLGSYASAFPTMLSGGQRQRVAVARAFVVEPDIVLFDEPFSALDEITARKLRLLTQELWQAGSRTGILVTHNTLEAAFLADRVVTLGAGAARIVSDVAVDIPRPRSAEDERLFQLHRRLLAELI
jgi:ABC-type nitrate/sulfonate/bicarbonate transport system ATPase subunit